MRSLAALAVCFYHFTNGNKTYLPDGSFLKVAGSFGNYGVHVFFVISGVVIPYSLDKGKYTLKSFKVFIIKRIIRIEPPYLASILIVLFLNYISTLSPYYRGEPFHIDFLNLLFHLGYANAFVGSKWLNPVYWTLAIEFQYYLLLAFLFPLLYGVRRYAWLTVLILFNCAGLLLTNPNLIFNYSLYFTIGIISYKFIVKTITLKEYLLYVGILFSLVFFKFQVPGLLAAITSVIFTFFTVDNSITVFLGNISYSLYLLHVPVGVRIINLSETFITGTGSRILVMIFALGVTIFASWLFSRYIEQPFKKRAKNLYYRRPVNNILTVQA